MKENNFLLVVIKNLEFLTNSYITVLIWIEFIRFENLIYSSKIKMAHIPKYFRNKKMDDVMYVCEQQI